MTDGTERRNGYKDGISTSCREYTQASNQKHFTAKVFKKRIFNLFIFIMSWTNTAILSIVELIIYTPFVAILLYTLVKHKRPGILGHVYFLIYITMRIITDAMAIADHNADSKTNTAGAILDSIGLSPLLLTTTGIISETMLYVAGHNLHQAKREKRKVVACELVMHVCVVTGFALLVVGTTNASRDTEQSEINNDRGLAKAGSVLLLMAWLISCLWLLETYRQSRLNNIRGSCRNLLMAVLLALPFLGARVVYTVVYACSESKHLNPATASFAVRFVLIFLVQLIAAIVLLAGLVLTRHMQEEGPSESTHGCMQKDISAQKSFRRVELSHALKSVSQSQSNVQHDIV